MAKGWKFKRNVNIRKNVQGQGERNAESENAGVHGNQEVQRQLVTELQGRISNSDMVNSTVGMTSAESAENTDAGMRRSSLSGLYSRLKTSERGGWHLHSGNSIYYKNVMESLNRIDEAMGRGFSADLKNNLERLADMEVMYQELLDACMAYTARNPGTEKGKNRRDIVLEIQKIAAKDMLGLSAARTEFCSIKPEEQAGKSWNEILDKARAIHLTVENYAEMSKKNKAEGGQVSEVFRMQGGDIRIQEADGTETPMKEMHFFKPEDEADLSQTEYTAQVVNKVLERFPALPKKERNAIRKWAMAPEDEEEPTGLSELGSLVLDTVKANAAGAETNYTEILKTSGIADEGGKVNMTKRNVATSRMAALLGLEHLVAKSETTEILDKATGQTIRGNLMEKANGAMDGNAFGVQFERALGKDKAVKVNNLVQRDLLNLQVLDVLCGQSDRHMGNIMIQFDRKSPITKENPLKGDETVTGIMGFDNDAAFGTNTDVVSRNAMGRKDRRVYDPATGEMTLPYMDKKLAERILELKPEVVRFALKGLITDAEIEAALKRLQLMQTAVTNTKKTHEERFLEDNQWNEETEQELFRLTWDSYGKLEKQTVEMRMERLKEIIPDIVKIPSGERTPEQKEIYNRLDKRLHKEIVAETDLKFLSMNNYYGKLMLASIRRLNGGFGDAPQLKNVRQ